MNRNLTLHKNVLCITLDGRFDLPLITSMFLIRMETVLALKLLCSYIKSYLTTVQICLHWSHDGLAAA